MRAAAKNSARSAVKNFARSAKNLGGFIFARSAKIF
jgi:hypothetical protein